MSNETKRHYIADESLGGIEREYTETDRKANAGDRVHLFNIGGYIKATEGGTIADGSQVPLEHYITLSPTDIIRHNGERYRLVDRKADVGDKVIVTNKFDTADVGYECGDAFTVIDIWEFGRGGVDVEGDDEESFELYHNEYNVLEPVIDEQEADAPTKSQPDSTPDLIDLVIRLTRKVAELEKTANNADFKAGQALTTAELQTENVDMLTDDIISLDERLGAEEEKSKRMTHVLGVSRRCCR